MLRQSSTGIAEKTWCISEFSLVNTFLLEGKRLAAMIDTGCGLGNIRSIVSSLTSKPLIVLLTHSHPDHAGGLYEFSDCPVYMNHLDEGERIFGMEMDNAFRKMYIETRGPSRFPGHIEDLLSLIPDPEPENGFSYIDAADGIMIDLGDRVLECILTPGHTKGSLCFLDSKTRILFSGDTVNKSIILSRQPDNSPVLIERYCRTLQKIWDREASFDYLAIGHDGPVIGKEIIHDYIRLCCGLLDGSIKGGYEESGFRKGDVARLGKAELWYQCDQ